MRSRSYTSIFILKKRRLHIIQEAGESQGNLSIFPNMEQLIPELPLVHTYPDKKELQSSLAEA